ncbi:hypothetical protein XAPC_2861 [Xanthomonas citri pv. punicae str. LMG 859]|nr:hypothetical protein XAPC_2861 [Xanthomonas citri pv. punicae str. LMG 859]
MQLLLHGWRITPVASALLRCASASMARWTVSTRHYALFMLAPRRADSPFMPARPTLALPHCGALSRTRCVS